MHAFFHYTRITFASKIHNTIKECIPTRNAVRRTFSMKTSYLAPINKIETEVGIYTAKHEFLHYKTAVIFLFCFTKKRKEF